MKAELNSFSHTEQSERRQPAYSRPSPRAKTLESRKPAPQHPSRRHSPVTTELREIGLAMHEILALADIMRESYGNGDLASIRHRLPHLMSKAMTLESALSNIMEQSTLKTESTDTTCERFDIAALLQEACEAARSTLGDKPVVIMDVSCPGPVIIQSDPAKIKRIVTCLMSNAAKFTARGRIALILGRDDDKIRLIVADTGRGMAPEEISVALKPAASEYDGEGNGHAAASPGLGVVKELVNKLNGSISIASKQGEGLIVEVTLPLEPSQ